VGRAGAGVDVSLPLAPAQPEVRGLHLADGRVLLAGATDSFVFDEGRAGAGAAPTLAPRSPLRSPSPPVVSGSGFHPVITASDGTVLASPTNQPIVRFVHLATGQVRFAETEYFDDGSAMLNVPGGWVPGHYAVQVSVAGRLSNPQLTYVARACSSDADCGGGSCSSDQVCCATPCSTGDCLAGRCSGGPTDAGVVDDGGVTADGGAPEADAGSTDAGADVDAGLDEAQHGADAGRPATPPRQLAVGFGCSATPGGLVLLMVTWALARRRPRFRP
jgi:hypothetical protein